VEGLAGGGFALIVKVHHCIVDGVAGIGMLASVVLDGDPAPGRPRVSSAGQPRPAPTSRELLRDEVDRRRAEASPSRGPNHHPIISKARSQTGCP
jgi:hypothetical protein